MQRRWKTLILSLTLPAVLGLGACADVSTTQTGAVGVNRKQRMLLSSDQVEEISAKAYQQEETKLRGAGKLNTDPALTARVRRVSDRLIRQATVFRPDAARWKWEVNVANAPNELNAYAMAGGKIMVYSGLMTKLNLSDDELAAVIGHEMAHALREHSRESMSQEYAQQMGLSVVGALAGLNESQLNLAAMATDVALSKPHSRTMENEADTMGLELMARAGYNPQAAISVWNKMIAQGQGGGIEFLSTHPSGPSRIDNLRRHLPQVMPLYEAARKR